MASLGARRLGGIQNSLFGAGLVKAEEFRIPEPEINPSIVLVVFFRTPSGLYTQGEYNL